MLTSLSIKNYTLIENLNIGFKAGFSVITGETGAGKSMLLGALGLVLGKRADLASLKNTQEKCVIEAVFLIEQYELKDFFESYDLDFEPQTIIRREILPSGKSRAFINDSPVNLSQLEELGNTLMDIHSQHQTRELSEEKFQFEVLDILAENDSLINEYSNELSDYKKNKKVLEKAQDKLKQAEKEQEYNLFVYNELEQANLQPNEQEVLEEEYEKLNNVETIKEVLLKTLSLSDSEVGGVSLNLNEINSSFARIADFSEDYQEISERINSLQIEYTDILQEVNRFSEAIFDNPEEIQRIGDRLQQLYDLQKKHKVANIDELIEIKNELEQKVISVDELETLIINAQKTMAKNQNKLDKIALKLHQKRTEAIKVFEQKITVLLAELGMENARFNIQLAQKGEYFFNGKDELQFLFSANKGGGFGLLKKTASGGELSRIMLAIKAIIAEYKAMPTIIFDEIDTGVSGEIAFKMAEIMQQMSQKRQVISITHLPQIAAKGNVHYKVYKSVTEVDTVSDLKILSDKQRVEEIAEMLSGKNPSDSALSHAQTLLTS